MDNSAESITARVRTLRMKTGMSMDAFAKALGYQRASSVQRYENPNEYQGGYLKRDLVAKIEQAVLGKGEPPISMSEIWELAGPEFSEVKPSKPRLVSSFDPDDDVQSGNGYTREHWKPHTSGAIPELDVKLGAGNGTIGEVINLPVGDNSVSGHKVIREWLIPVDYLQDEIKASPRHSTIMEVIGDSMQPTYLPGDRVIVDLSQDTMSTDTVYAISYDDEPPQIKRLQKVPFSDPKQVKIISDNPILETFSVELDKLTIIGRICGHIARK